jgi:hypothetical protein
LRRATTKPAAEGRSRQSTRTTPETSSSRRTIRRNATSFSRP